MVNRLKNHQNPRPLFFLIKRNNKIFKLNISGKRDGIIKRFFVLFFSLHKSYHSIFPLVLHAYSSGSMPHSLREPLNQQSYLCTSQRRNMDHVDVEHQVEALWLDSSPVLIGQRSIQVDGRLHIVQPVAGSICFYTNGKKKTLWEPSRPSFWSR